MGKGVVDERHGRSIGTAALTDHDYIHCAINRADLIINVGHDIVEKPPFIMTKDGMKVVHINYFNARIDDVYFPQYEVIGDIAENLLALTLAIKPCKDQDTNYFIQIKNEIENHVYSCKESDAFPSTPQKIVSDIRDSMPDDGIISLDNGMYKIWFARNYKAYESNTVLLDNALATMGAGLPVAISAKLINPEIKVAAICGDGGFMMNSQELETAVRLNINLVVVILKDNAYGMIKWKQTGLDLQNFGLDFGNPDFVKYAKKKK